MTTEVHPLTQRKLTGFRIDQFQIDRAIADLAAYGVIDLDPDHTLGGRLESEALIRTDLVGLLVPTADPAHLAVHESTAVTLRADTAFDIDARVTLDVMQIDNALHGVDVEVIDGLLPFEVTCHPVVAVLVGARINAAVAHAELSAVGIFVAAGRGLPAAEDFGKCRLSFR